ncbi:hypothetical protein CsatA_009850 [Cannabis sativa]
MVNLVENVEVEYVSLDLIPDDADAKDLIGRSLVGKFFVKLKISNGRLCSILSDMWNVNPGWCIQKICPETYIFCFAKEADALKIIGMGPWLPYGGFLLLTMMSDDGKGSYVDLQLGWILRKKMVKKYGAISNMNDSLCSVYKCGVIGHMEEMFLTKKRMLTLNDGRRVPPYGPWLKFSSRSKNGFVVLTVEGYQECIEMESEIVPNA